MLETWQPIYLITSFLQREECQEDGRQFACRFLRGSRHPGSHGERRWWKQEEWMKVHTESMWTPRSLPHPMHCGACSSKIKLRITWLRLKFLDSGIWTEGNSWELSLKLGRTKLSIWVVHQDFLIFKWFDKTRPRGPQWNLAESLHFLKESSPHCPARRAGLSPRPCLGYCLCVSWASYLMSTAISSETLSTSCSRHKREQEHGHLISPSSSNTDCSLAQEQVS